jgi:hypothetical protein
MAGMRCSEYYIHNIKGNIPMTSFDRFSGFGDHGGVPFEKARPKKPKTTRFAGYAGVDEEGYIPNEKRETITKSETTMSDADNPYYKMIDEEALALQQQTGMSYASCFAKAYTDPSNKTIVEKMQYEHLAKQHDVMFGNGLATPVKKAEAPADAVEDDLDASRRGDPGSARAELHRRVDEHMRDNPGLSYERAFTAIYLHPNNRSLKQRVDMESELHARSLSGGKPFPRYTSPGHRGVNAASNIGREGSGGEDF